MSVDHGAVADLVARHGRVVRVLVAEVRGSTPREAGAAMLVWEGGQSGTIGGGALEFAAVAAARALDSPRRVARHALGPDMGQCCGGAVTLLYERVEAGEVLPAGPRAQPLRGDGPMPPEVADAVARMPPGAPPRVVAGWLVEAPVAARHALWLWGAGHVGRAVAAVLAPLPDWSVTWLDTGPERFPDALPAGVVPLPAVDLPRAAALAPADAHHLILTYSHDLDLALCDAVLRRGFASAGLIGSATKWSRFRKRLGQMGHADAQIARIACPIGEPALGKHPQAIAVGVVRRLLIEQMPAKVAERRTGD